MQHKLPRWSKGTKITADQLNQLAEAIERGANIGADASSGLSIQETGHQRIISAVRQRVYIYGQASGDISARSGSTIGTGKVNRYYVNDSGVLQPYGGDPEDCRNLVSATIPGGTWVGLNADEDGVWVAVLEDCS